MFWRIGEVWVGFLVALGTAVALLFAAALVGGAATLLTFGLGDIPPHRLAAVRFATNAAVAGCVLAGVARGLVFVRRENRRAVIPLPTTRRR